VINLAPRVTEHLDAHQAHRSTTASIDTRCHRLQTVRARTPEIGTAGAALAISPRNVRQSARQAPETGSCP